MWKVAARSMSALAIASLGACGDQPAPAPAPPPVAPPSLSPVPAVPPSAESAPAVPRDLDPRVEWVRADAALADVTLTWVFAEPYVVFQQLKRQDVRDTRRTVDSAGAPVETPIDGTVNPATVRQNEVWARKGEAFAKREAALLVELHRRFRELFAERFKLPDIASTRRTLTALVMWDRKSFDKMCAETGQPGSHFVRAFYSPTAQRLFTYIGDEALMQSDELKCAGGRVQKKSDQSLCWVGTLQLLHEYGAIHRGVPLEDAAVPGDHAYWFTIGFAEWMSAVEVDDAHLDKLSGAAWSHERLPLETIETAGSARDVAEKWTIGELLEVRTNADKVTLGERLAPGYGPHMANAFACRAWALVHFLWNYDDGRYRSRFLDFLGLVLAGTESADKFVKDVMNRPSADDWGPVAMEFEWYWRQLLNRRVGRDRKTGEWFTPSTDAPQGRAEDDAEFVARWRADHPPGAAPSKR